MTHSCNYAGKLIVHVCSLWFIVAYADIDLQLKPRKRDAIVTEDEKVEQAALMEDLKWDLATGADPALRKIIREAIASDPSRLSRHHSSSNRLSRRSSTSEKGDRKYRANPRRPTPTVQSAWGTSHTSSNNRAQDQSHMESTNTGSAAPVFITSPSTNISSQVIDGAAENDCELLNDIPTNTDLNQLVLQRQASLRPTSNHASVLLESHPSSSIRTPHSETPKVTMRFIKNARIERVHRKPGPTLPVRDWQHPGKWKYGKV